MKILAIETSCDDTGIAILEYNETGQPRLLANLVSSQVKIHAKWGGVVPMLAKREHQRNLTPLLKQALKKMGALTLVHHSEPRTRNSASVRDKLREESRGSDLPAKALAAAGTTHATDPCATAKALGDTRSATSQDDKIKILNKILEREPELFKKLLPFLNKYQKPDIDSIAVTVGPGLEPALWVGVNFARALAYFWNIPIIPVNHIEGHIAANWLESINGITNDPLDYARGKQFSMTKILPSICLVASGGHTQLVLIKNIGQYKIIGETRDDAAGEAFDKVAKMLNIGYPGGPAISRLAEKWKFQTTNSKSQTSSKNKIKLPRPMIKSDNFDFSFSGLKTAVLYALQKMTPAQIKKLAPALAAEFQQAVIDVLIAKTMAAAKKYRVKNILLAGGVAANEELRATLKNESARAGFAFLTPPRNFCTDNAAMIALAAKNQLKKKTIAWQKIQAQANLRIS